MNRGALALAMVLACLGCSERAPLRKAEDLFQEGRYEEAVRTYRSIVYADPDSQAATEALLQIGIIENLFLRDPDSALEAWSDLVRRHPRSPQALTAHLALANLERDQYHMEAKAIGEYERALQDFPRAPHRDRIRFHLAQCYVLMGSYDRARSEFEEILRRFPTSDLAPEVHYQIASTRYLQGDCPGARRDYQQLVRDFPRKPIALEAELGTATCLEEEGDLDQALQVLKGLLDRYPNRDVIALKIARIEERREQQRR